MALGRHGPDVEQAVAHAAVRIGLTSTEDPVTVALLSLLGAALLGLISLVERHLAQVADRVDVVARSQARMEGQIATLDREVGQILDHVLGSETRS